MAKEKVCKKCNLFVEGDMCPLCKSTSFTNVYKGVIFVIDSQKSEFAKKLDIDSKGFYAIQTR